MKCSYSILILLISFQTTYSLSCIPDQELEYSFADYDRTRFEKKLNALNLTKVSINRMCAVLITMNYEEQIFTLDCFSTTIQNTSSDDECSFHTAFAYEKDKKVILTNELELACRDYDGCQKRFIFDYVPWLISETYTDLYQALMPFIVNHKPSGESKWNCICSNFRSYT
ncbi:unnamed protein product [Adineta ricciae]|uniref:Uncharacterized protein n=1 Tax=Adineta ricciae TaxID=249248 RepID=A0A815IBA1_ADIRI|nr:unnamed protein product [Adineta ricciae]